MNINTLSNIEFKLEDSETDKRATLQYEDSGYKKGNIYATESYGLKFIAIGTWAVSLMVKGEEKLASTIKTEIGGSMSITKFYRLKKYYFKKSQNLKLRFSLFNKDQEELLTIIPSVNWQKQSHDFVLQINEDFKRECDELLILQAIHCANCSLSMMTGGEVPALISV